MLSSRRRAPLARGTAPLPGQPGQARLGRAGGLVLQAYPAPVAASGQGGQVPVQVELASNGDDIDAAIDAYAELVAHVQIADAPGRGEPGSGQLDLDRYLAALADRGYRGWVSLEYKPTGTTEASLAWLPRERRAGQMKEQS